jgi:alpha-amylase
MLRRLFLILVVCGLWFPSGSFAQDTAEGGEVFWWNDRVFYQIFVRSFYDSDGDGIGDLQGVIEKLDYLNDGDPNTTDDLGVTGIWLMPIMPSPSYHGYDVTDYYGINPEYGTEEDFQQLIDEAHQRGIAVIIDLVLNHTSSQHPWFVESQNPDSEKADWYVWEDEDPGYRGPTNQQVWHRRADRYYYALFWSEMPDLNYRNPEVTEQMYDVSRFWLEEMGVDGFRLDAVKHFVEEGRSQENTPATHDWMQAYYDYVRSVKSDAILAAEIWTSTNLVLPYIGDEVDIAFEFDLAQAMVRASSFGLPNTVKSVLLPVVEQYPEGQYGTFLANHDQDRFMSQVRGNPEAAKLGAYMLLTLPGVPFIYYGEEIGMVGRRTLPDTDAQRRTPMQWDDSENAGFTTGTPWFEVNTDYDTVNVEAERADPDSLWNVYNDLIDLRNENEALRTGDFAEVTSDSRKVLSYLRYNADQTLLVVINMDDRPITEYGLSLESNGLSAVTGAALLLGAGEVTPPILTAEGGFEHYLPLPELPPYSISIVEFTP